MAEMVKLFILDIARDICQQPTLLQSAIFPMRDSNSLVIRRPQLTYGIAWRSVV